MIGLGSGERIADGGPGVHILHVGASLFGALALGGVMRLRPGEPIADGGLGEHVLHIGAL